MTELARRMAMPAGADQLDDLIADTCAMVTKLITAKRAVKTGDHRRAWDLIESAMILDANRHLTRKVP